MSQPWTRRLRFAALVALLTTAAFHAFIGLEPGAVSHGGDLRIFTSAGQRGLSNGWRAIYDSGHGPSGMAFVDLPLVALIGAALSLTGALAWPIWIAASGLAITVAVLLVTRDRLWLAVTASSMPVVLTLTTGQMSGLVLLALALAFWLIQRERPLEAGLAIAIAAQLKPTAVFAVPLALLAARHWRVLVGVVIGGVVALALYVALLGGDFPVLYWNAAHSLGTNGATVGAAIPLAGPLGGYLPRVPVLALVAVAAHRARRLDLVVGVGILGSALLSPFVEGYDLLPLLLVGIVLNRRLGGWMAAALFGPGLVLWNLGALPHYNTAFQIWELATLIGAALILDRDCSAAAADEGAPVEWTASAG